MKSVTQVSSNANEKTNNYEFLVEKARNVGIFY